MSDKKPDKAKDAAPKAAVEVDDKDLDQAAGGVLIGLNQPAQNLSLNYSKIEAAAQKVAPGEVQAAGGQCNLPSPDSNVRSST